MQNVLVDVRTLAPKQRHAQVFAVWGKLGQGAALELVNDHDPLPLYYQLACEHTGTFHWDYLEKGPEVWRVRITKGDYPDPGFKPPRKKPAAKGLADCPLTVDTRPLFQRGEPPCALIDEAAAQTPVGGSFVLLVPFEPLPLYAKLAREGFTHKAELQTDGSWRVEFFKEK
ncbi:MAG: DUF2249 domain-containing protein [Verrucomicrobiae bacterium]|nr:DUF2249 domain-containing protein [Verrucomicrobiae bacterium]